MQTDHWIIFRLKQDKKKKKGYLGLRFSGLTQGKDGMSSLAGRWFKPVSPVSLAKGDAESSSLANGWGEGLRPLPSWTGDRQRALMWRSSSPNGGLRRGWRTGLSIPCNRGTLLCWECLMSSSCSSSCASIIKGSSWSIEAWPWGDDGWKMISFL